MVLNSPKNIDNFKELQDEHHTNTHKIIDINNKIYYGKRIDLAGERTELLTRNDEINKIMNKMYSDKSKEYIEDITKATLVYNSLNHTHMRGKQRGDIGLPFKCKYCN